LLCGNKCWSPWSGQRKEGRKGGSKVEGRERRRKGGRKERGKRGKEGGKKGSTKEGRKEGRKGQRKEGRNKRRKEGRKGGRVLSSLMIRIYAMGQTEVGMYIKWIFQFISYDHFHSMDG
jgi:hypothetical protein